VGLPVGWWEVQLIQQVGEQVGVGVGLLSVGGRGVGRERAAD